MGKSANRAQSRPDDGKTKCPVNGDGEKGAMRNRVNKPTITATQVMKNLPEKRRETLSIVFQKRNTDEGYGKRGEELSSSKSTGVATLEQERVDISKENKRIIDTLKIVESLGFLGLE